MDDRTKKLRSKCMSKIRAKHTKPELAVRKALTALGIKYRLYSNKLPGKPDIIIRKKKTVIFVNGCFWHQHKGCKRQFLPKSNKSYWHKKLANNVQRQKNDIKTLRKMGWNAIIIWECEAKKNNLSKLIKKRIYAKK